MKHALTRLLTIIFTFSLHPLSLGQDSTRTKLSVINLSNDTSISQITWLRASGRPEKDKLIDVSTSSIMPPIKYSGPKTLTLVNPNQPDPSTEKKYTVLAKVSIPTSNQVIVALVSPPKNSKNNTAQLQAMAIDASVAKIPLGTRNFYNFTTQQIRGVMGQLPFDPKSKKNRGFRLKSRQNKIVPSPIPNAPDRTGMQAYLEYFDNSSTQWKRFRSSRWFHRPSQRKLIFVYPQSKSQLPSIKVFSIHNNE